MNFDAENNPNIGNMMGQPSSDELAKMESKPTDLSSLTETT